MNIMRALADAIAIGWWSFCIRVGGRAHPSYPYCALARFIARHNLDRFLSGEEG